MARLAEAIRRIYDNLTTIGFERREDPIGRLGHPLRAVVEKMTVPLTIATIDEVAAVISKWIDRYNNERPHSSLGYLTPAAWRERDKARITSLSV